MHSLREESSVEPIAVVANPYPSCDLCGLHGEPYTPNVTDGCLLCGECARRAARLGLLVRPLPEGLPVFGATGGPLLFRVLPANGAAAKAARS